jgi:hypothetical protein
VPGLAPVAAERSHATGEPRVQEPSGAIRNQQEPMRSPT